MARRPERSLLDEIERDALADPPRVAAALRRCIALGGRAKSTELRQWASRELNGYDSFDDVPSYRVVAAPLMVDGQSGNYQIKREHIDYSDLPDVVRESVPEDVHLVMSVAELESLAAGHDEHIHLGLPQAAIVSRLMTAAQGPFQRVQRVYWSMARASVVGVLDAVATRVVEMVAEIRAGLPAEEETPSQELATAAFQVAVHGEGNRVAIQPATSIGGSASPRADQGEADRGWRNWSWTQRIGTVAVGIATIAGAVFAWLAL